MLSSQVNCNLVIELDPFWEEVFQLDAANFSCVCPFNLQCLKNNSFCQLDNIRLVMTE